MRLMSRGGWIAGVLLIIVGLGLGLAWSWSQVPQAAARVVTPAVPASVPTSPDFVNDADAPRVAHVRVRVYAEARMFKPYARVPGHFGWRRAVAGAGGVAGPETVCDLYLVEQPGETLAVADAGEGRRLAVYLGKPEFFDDRIEFISRGFSFNWSVRAPIGAVSGGQGHAVYGTPREPRPAVLTMGRPRREKLVSLGGEKEIDGQVQSAHSTFYIEFTLLSVEPLAEAMRVRDELAVGVPKELSRKVWAYVSPEPGGATAPARAVDE